MVTAPADGAGTVDVTVTTAGGTSATGAGDHFTYLSPPPPPPAAPTVTGVSPASGSTAGGTVVDITGADLGGATAVDFGGVQGTVTTDTPTLIVVTAPADGAGTVDVTVTTAGGTSATGAGDHFTYLSPPPPPPAAPTVTGVSPASGSTAGGTVVDITGADLGGATAVDFGGVQGTVTTDTPTLIVVTAPADGAGTVDITVTTAGGTSATGAGDHFTYLSPPPPPPAAPTVTGVSPASGSTAGGPWSTSPGPTWAGPRPSTSGASRPTLWPTRPPRSWCSARPTGPARSTSR
ncbi:hypothetical protein FRUB_09215 [Fimbriiglobus ruber]|uniref:IPT/TIG domain-containing protein n=1 Tax=Fimbriiglobus ruber TaxID=1908690 RepID=A0A225D592_9BACT|nr:hypothetical protein FRUB_09215 [Fimbriiglobus ruber]